MNRVTHRIPTTLIIGLCSVVSLSACQRSDSPPPVMQNPQSTKVVEPLPRDDVAPSKEQSEADAEPASSDSIVTLPEDAATQPARPVFRSKDQRPRHDDARLKRAGIEVYESKHLKLYTDVEANVAKTLPSLIDQVYAMWEQRLAPLPLDAEGADFQMTGYLIKDMPLFRELGLIPEELHVQHGLQFRNEFWMRDQVSDYYRRHLLIHEATHCYMTYLPGSATPVWYHEGLAEYFGTHRLNEENQATFCVMPTSDDEFFGFGRISVIRSEIAAKKPQSLYEILHFSPTEFQSTRYYAWSWALCEFLDRSVRYRDRFRELSRVDVERPFSQRFIEAYRKDERDLETEWALFSNHLQFGYDIERATIDFQKGTALSSEHPDQTVKIVADRGWQSTRVQLDRGQHYEVIATGQFTLSQKPKPWLSEPQGITFRYFDGHPIGVLLGTIRTEDAHSSGKVESMLQTMVIGRGTKFESPLTGTLYLRLNDAWNSLDDNQGHVDVIVRQVDRH